ncbi:MAG: glycosyltransferase, partial [Pseudomonadota bacterium]
WCSFKCADVSIATNESYRKIAVERGGKSPEDVFIVRSGPRLDRFQPRPPKPKLKRGKTHLVGYVGVIGFQEGLDLYIDAVEHLVRAKGREDIHSIIIGSGPELEAVKAYAAEKGLTEHIEFTGRAPDDLLLDVLYTADVCVNPDRFNAMNDQSTMNKTMEYMAAGRAMVQFDLKESRYSAQSASLYAKPDDIVDFADKIEDLLDDPTKRAAMGAFGRKRVEDDLSWKESIAPLLAAYERVFARLGRAPGDVAAVNPQTPAA